jgi:hypothetical protein
MQIPFGPTGRFPNGKLNERDEGELLMGVATDKDKHIVLLNFGKPISWIGLTPEIAIILGQTLIRKANELG